MTAKVLGKRPRVLAGKVCIIALLGVFNIGSSLGQGLPGAGIAINGTITLSSGQGISGVTIALSNSDLTVITDANGNYSAPVPSGYTGVATPSLFGYTFNPTSRSYSGIAAIQNNQNYIGSQAATSYTVSGTILTSTGQGISGVTVTFNNGGPTAVTDSTGNYMALVPSGYSGIAAPSLSGYTFTPANISYMNVGSNQSGQNYTATVQTSSVVISGAVSSSSGVGINGVTIVLNNGGSSALTDSNGNYTTNVPVGYSGTATPTLSGYTFNPASRSYNDITGNQNGQNYAGAVSATITITGTVRVSSSQGLLGVSIGFTNGPTVTTDANGIYTASVASGYSGLATPTLASYTFSPTNRVYNHVVVTQSDQDYVATIASAPSVTFTQYGTALLSNSNPTSIVTGSDGALWFCQSFSGIIGRITTTGAITQFTIPTPDSSPQTIVAGPDNALWFTEYNTNKIGRITTAGAITEYVIPTNGSSSQQLVGMLPIGITRGPDGALWFTEYIGGIGRITTTGVITQFSTGLSSGPQAIATGSDGALWFTDYASNRIGRITTAGEITAYYVISNIIGNNPIGIAAGPDGALWFAEFAGQKIGRITTDGMLTEYSVPSSGGPEGITVGPDGALWFTEYSDSIGRITTDGEMTEYSVPLAAGFLNPGIALGPDGALWFTELSAIGRAVLTATGVGNTPTISSVASSASGISGMIAAGEIITIKGTNLGPASPASGTSFALNAQGSVNSTLAGVQVLFDNTPGTPTYVSATQINVIAPWEIAGTGTTNIVVSFGGEQSQGISLPVVGAEPGIYTFNSTGSGQAAAVNLTGTNAGRFNGPAAGVTIGGNVVPTAPAAPGSFIELFLTGGGQTNPASITGSVNPSNTLLPLKGWTAGSSIVTAMIGGQPATVQFAGAAPSLITGVVQVNLQVPNGISGNSLPLNITINGLQTPTGVTVAVQ